MMRRFAIALVFVLGWASLGRAQGSRKDDVVLNPRGQPMAGATVRVCTASATGQPCAPLANIYSDAALTQAKVNPTATDGLGNFFFYAAPGRYLIELSGPGITTAQFKDVILPSDPNTPSFTKVNNIRFADQFASGSSTGGIQEAINDVPAGGGIVVLPSGAVNVAATISVTKPNVLLIGHGSGAISDAAGFTPGSPQTVMNWTGSAGGTVIEFSATAGASNPALKGGGLENAKVDGNSSAAVCVSLKSLQHGAFRNLFVKGCTTANFDLSVVSPLASGEPTDDSRNTFETIEVRAIDSGQEAAFGFRFQGDSVGNVSFNTFRNLYLQYKNGAAIQVLNGDNNDFFNVLARRAAGGTANGVVVDQSTGGANSKNNYFWHLDPGAGGFVQQNGANNNVILGYDRSNGAPAPTIASGNLIWLENELSGNAAFYVPHYKGSGAALVSGDFSLSGWGSGASVGTVAGTDQGFEFTITSGTGPGASPTATLTFKLGWGASPVAVCGMKSGGSGAVQQILVAPTATTLVITYNGTPGASQTFPISCVLMGR